MEGQWIWRERGKLGGLEKGGETAADTSSSQNYDSNVVLYDSKVRVIHVCMPRPVIACWSNLIVVSTLFFPGY